MAEGQSYQGKEVPWAFPWPLQPGMGSSIYIKCLPELSNLYRIAYFHYVLGLPGKVLIVGGLWGGFCC